MPDQVAQRHERTRGARRARSRLPLAAVALGALTPWAVAATLLPWWEAAWLLPVAVLTLPLMPVVVGLTLTRGRARLRQVGVGVLALTLLLGSAWGTRDGEFGAWYAFLLAAPAHPVVIGVPIALERSLPPGVRGYGLGLAVGGACLLMVLAVPPAVALVPLVALATAAVLIRDRLPRVTVVRIPPGERGPR